MPDNIVAPAKKSVVYPPITLALVFSIFGLGWILLSDYIFLQRANNNLSWYHHIQNYKGVLFVLLAALLIFLVSDRLYRRQLRATRQMEDALNRYNALGKATNDCIWDMDLKSGCLYINPAMEAFTGMNSSEMQTKTQWWEEQLHPNEKERVLRKMEESLNSQDELWQDEYRFMCKEGVYKTVLDRALILRDEDGKASRLIGTMQDVTEQRALQEAFLQTRLQYQNNLAQAIVHAQEEERKRVGEDLHDNINQLLGVVKLYIDHMRMESTLLPDLMEKCSGYLAQVMFEIRSISKNMMPPGLGEIGLVESISDQIAGIAIAKNIKIDLDIHEFDESQIGEARKLMLYRIVQEQLHNILRHSEATEVLIEISYINRMIALSIADNGVGFNLTDEKNGIGLNNIRNRLEVFNGAMKISTSPGKGCRLHITFAA